MQRLSNKPGLFVLLLLFLLMTSACKNRKVLSGPANLPNLKAKELKEQILANQFNFTTLSGKFSAALRSEKKNLSVNVNFRMQKDSIIWFSISPALGIEVFRILITPDSVRYVDKLHNTYYRGNYAVADSLLKAKLDFDFLQRFLTGSALLPDEAKYSADVEDGKYLLRIKAKAKETPAPILLNYWINPELFKVERATIEAENRPETLLIVYDDFTGVGGQKFPQSSSVLLNSPLESATFELSFSRIRLNESETFPFKIPSSYSPVH